MPSYAIAPIFPSAGSIGKLRAGLSPNGHKQIKAVALPKNEIRR